MFDANKYLLDKADAVSSKTGANGVSSAINHLKIAARHFERAISEDDADFFTDAIYRSNQVFEGMLKEAFSIFTGKDASKMTPYKIETSLHKEKMITERVMPFFDIYRTQWRNPSTHNHQLTFSEQEAFLALSTVSSFCFILLDQMARHIALEQAESATRSEHSTHQGVVTTEVVAELLRSASVSFQEYFGNQDGGQSQSAIVGYVQGFILGAFPEVEVDSEHRVSSGDSSYFVDLLLHAADGPAPIDVKLLSHRDIGRRVRDALNSLASLAKTLKATSSVLVLAHYGIEEGAEFASLRSDYIVDGVNVHVVEIPLLA